MMDYSTNYDSPLGKILLVSDGDALCGLYFYDHLFFKDSIYITVENDDLDVFIKAKRWLDEYFEGKNPKIDFKIKPEGSEFRLKVWKIIQEIPYGETLTYGEIASKISPTMAPQAVGGAVGHNPVSIIIPCHRVLGAGGKLTGYAGGIERKMKLLDLEKISYMK